MCVCVVEGLQIFILFHFPILFYHTCVFFFLLKYSWFTIMCSVQLLSHVQLFVFPWTTTCQASLSITNSWSLLKLMSIVLVMPSNYVTLCHSLLLLPSIFPNIRVFSYESVLHIIICVKIMCEFQMYNKVIWLYIYICIYLYSFLWFFSIIAYYIFS